MPIHRRGVANSTFFSAIDLGIGGGSVLLGYIVSLYSIANMFIVCAILLLIAMAFFFFVALKHYRNHTRNNSAELILEPHENE